jgi:hypothetical protein
MSRTDLIKECIVGLLKSAPFGPSVKNIVLVVLIVFEVGCLTQDGAPLATSREVLSRVEVKDVVFDGIPFEAAIKFVESHMPVSPNAILDPKIVVDTRTARIEKIGPFATYEDDADVLLASFCKHFTPSKPMQFYPVTATIHRASLWDLLCIIANIEDMEVAEIGGLLVLRSRHLYECRAYRVTRDFVAMTAPPGQDAQRYFNEAHNPFSDGAGSMTNPPVAKYFADDGVLLLITVPSLHEGISGRDGVVPFTGHFTIVHTPFTEHYTGGWYMPK